MGRGFGGAGGSSEQQACPCGGGVFADCCAPLIEAARTARTAEQLMRSRYSAFALGSRSARAIDHLLRTHPEPGRDPRERRRDLQASCRAVQWLGLSVLATDAGGAADAGGTVTFEARWRSRRRPRWSSSSPMRRSTCSDGSCSCLIRICL